MAGRQACYCPPALTLSLPQAAEEEVERSVLRGEAFQWFPSSLSSRAGLVSLGLFRSSLPFRKGSRQAGASLLQLGEALLTQAFPDNTGFCYSPYKPALCSGFPQTNMETFTGQPILHVCFPPSVTPCLKTTLGLKSQQPLTTSIPLSKP